MMRNGGTVIVRWLVSLQSLSGVGVVVAVGTNDDESADSASLLLQLYLTIIAAAASPVLPSALYLWRESKRAALALRGVEPASQRPMTCLHVVAAFW
jgi:hypothetical protein